MSKIESKVTTLRIPKAVYRLAERLAAARDVSLNGFIAETLEIALKQLEREEIDAAFEDMAADHVYQREAIVLSKEFAVADYEAGLGKDERCQP